MKAKKIGLTACIKAENMDRIFYRSGHSGSYGNGKLFAEYRCIENGVVQFMDAAHAVLQQLFLCAADCGLLCLYVEGGEF